MRRLILNADDFGLTPGINRAVAELHAAEVLTSATLMATGPAFDDAVLISRQHPTLGVGCHVVLVDGTPASHPEDIPTLLGADRTTFRRSLAEFAGAALRGTIREEEIVREVSAQVQRLQAAGIHVTHLDTHKHTHLFPLVHRAVLQTATHCGVPAIRNPFEPSWNFALGQGSFSRRASMRFLNLNFHRGFDIRTDAARPPVGTTRGTIGISATGELTPIALENILEALPARGTFELVLHPGYNDTALTAANTRLRESREIEREALLRQIPLFSLRPNAPHLIHYGDLGVEGRPKS